MKTFLQWKRMIFLLKIKKIKKEFKRMIKTKKINNNNKFYIQQFQTVIRRWQAKTNYWIKYFQFDYFLLISSFVI
ncbi:unnamed protein product [Paramecium sonneborni]|uniref:Uncharacterized protein n=1 Tax=Paramecium sonneborni TaxID=65129 RepID=A0A8S1MVG0_9CILI|nr:unnamed protein product [Paramecium sonneborni]